jgi:hypothetical protein
LFLLCCPGFHFSLGAVCKTICSRSTAAITHHKNTNVHCILKAS